MTTDQQIYETILELEKRGTPAVLVTVVDVIGSAPRKAGAKMLVLENGSIIGTVGGAMLEARAIRKAVHIMEDGTGTAESVSYSLDDVEGRDTKMICGGTVQLFFEPVAVTPWLYMFGAGHCGRSIADAAHSAGFACVVVDEREEFTRRERFPYAADIRCGHIPSVARELPYRAHAYVVIATYCYETDVETAVAVLESGMPEYIGIIGSRKKRIAMRGALTGVVGDGDFERISMPMGIDIGAETPEEIAVSVVAEMIRARRKAFRAGRGGIHAATADSARKEPGDAEH